MNFGAEEAVGEEVSAATLACLPKISPSRLRALVDHFGGMRRAVCAVQEGRAAEALFAARGSVRAAGEEHELARLWASRADPQAIARHLAQRGTHVWTERSDEYPILDEVPDRPAVLLAEGQHPGVLDRPRVAVVGTRAATPHGLADARELGAFLAGAAVTVVSGMAIGIDGAAHDGVLGAGGGAVGVIATGLDIEYPRRHRSLYERVRRSGVVIGETGFGVRPDPGRFPVRNRIIAALADIVVVVEATIRGGARITAQFALEYGRTVMAVPGSRRNAAAEGTNALIVDGAHPLVDWSDILVELGLSVDGRQDRAPTRTAPSADGRSVLAALAGEAAIPDQLASRTGLAPDRIALTIIELERTGWVERAQGAIWPR
jgi:DNA processing protein